MIRMFELYIACYAWIQEEWDVCCVLDYVRLILCLGCVDCKHFHIGEKRHRFFRGEVLMSWTIMKISFTLMKVVWRMIMPAECFGKLHSTLEHTRMYFLCIMRIEGLSLPKIQHALMRLIICPFEINSLNADEAF